MSKFKYLPFVICLLLVVITGCDYNKFQIELTAPKSFAPGQSSLIQLKILDTEGKPVKGAKVSAELKMERMSHGDLSMEMQETNDGVYVGNTAIEMEGNYTVNISIQYKGEKWTGEKRFSIVSKTK
ncbi:FixH family protein [Neobacillus muris]|uniref:FixH family protein n=1 Tax=Neobacillus muris TaxID=2941334 RepID=UPI002040C249|nr:FixH family protein [Neobacillus muris]